MGSRRTNLDGEPGQNPDTEPSPGAQQSQGQHRERNRNNARRSTGPRTRGGKAAVAANGIRHGMRFRSDVPAIPSWESVDEWVAHRDAIGASLAPVGALETALADRVAGILWRLGRVVRYETEQSESLYQGAEDHLRALRRFSNPRLWGGAPDPQDVRDAVACWARSLSAR